MRENFGFVLLLVLCFCFVCCLGFVFVSFVCYSLLLCLFCCLRVCFGFSVFFLFWFYFSEKSLFSAYLVNSVMFVSEFGLLFVLCCLFVFKFVFVVVCVFKACFCFVSCLSFCCVSILFDSACFLFSCLVY